MYGIIGHRSWIAKHLVDELARLEIPVAYYPKSMAGHDSFRGVTNLIVFGGRARPTDEELAAEHDLVTRLRNNKSCPRVTYLSSSTVDEWEETSKVLSPAGERYVLLKRQCEALILGSNRYKNSVVRAPAIFGPGQDIMSSMLFPSIMRAVQGIEDLVLSDPSGSFEMCYVGELVKVLSAITDSCDPLPVTSVRSRQITPMELISKIAPGLPFSVRTGWTYRSRPRLAHGIHHATKITIELLDSDLQLTAAWYNQQNKLTSNGVVLKEITAG